jgi:hypothetical protein
LIPYYPTYRKREFVVDRKPRQHGFPEKPASIALAVILAMALFNIPIITTPLFSIFNVTRNGSQVAANFRLQNSLYFGTAYVNGSIGMITALYNSSGIAQSGFCFQMAPIADGSQPLRIPECGGGGGLYYYAEACFNSPGLSICTDSTTWSWSGCLVPTYTTECVPVLWIHLAPSDAINGQTAMAVMAFIAGILLIVSTAGAGTVLAILMGLLAIAYSALYQADKNSDSSFDIWIPYDSTNIALGIVGELIIATPHWWWHLHDNIIPLAYQSR